MKRRPCLAAVDGIGFAVMRRMVKWIFRIMLAVALLLAVLMATFSQWAPWAFDEAAPGPLRRFGFTEADIKLKRLSVANLRLAVERLAYRGITMSNAEVHSEYTISGLQRGAVETITVEHPEVSVDLTAVIAPAEPKSDLPAAPLKLPARLPVGDVNIEGLTLNILGEDWSREFGANVRLATGDRVRGRFDLAGHGAALRGVAVASWPELSGRARIHGQLDHVADWLAFAEARGLASLPDALTVGLGPVKARADAGFADMQPTDWRAAIETTALSAALGEIAATSKRIELDVSGEAFDPDQVAAKLLDGKVDVNGLGLNFGQFTANSVGARRLNFSLADWKVAGDAPLGELGVLSLEAGDVEVSVNGPWRVWMQPFDPQSWSARLFMKESPVKMFSGLGSVTGNLRLDAGFTAGETRFLSARLDLADADVSLEMGRLRGDALELSVHGELPKALAARLGLSGGQVSWSGDVGELLGLNGAVELSSVQPIQTDGVQTLTFDSMRQGKFSMKSGRLTFSFDDETATGVPQLDAEFHAGALGGEVTLFVKGSIVDPRSLRIRAKLDRVQLAEVAALLPDFEGSITGQASGELAVRLEGKKIVLQPGYLELTPGTTGRFRYTRQGWLTQDPKLNPEAFVRGKDIVTIMKAPQGAPVVTELAMRDLRMTYFRFDVLEPGTGDRRAKAQIKGDSTVHGITVPVVLDVPIRGDLKEYVNLVLQFNEKM
ncbi:MAG: hypothetical protein ACQKBV_05790 [Puniceicoccales bacterium]